MTTYAKRVALIATSSSLTKVIETIVVRAADNHSYSAAMSEINVEVRNNFDCRIFPITNSLSPKKAEETFFEFAREFGKVSPIVGAVVEYNDNIEAIKRSGL